LKRRLVLITEIIAPYRIPVLNALAQIGDIDLEVIFLSETDPSLRQWNIYKDEIRFRYQVLPSFRCRIGKSNVLLNRGLAGALAKTNPNVVLCGGYNYVAAWQALLWAQNQRVPFLLWLESTAADQRRNFALIESLKRYFVARCRGFVVPGKASAEYLGKLKVSSQAIFRAPNAIDNAFFFDQADHARQDTATLRHKLALPNRYFLFVGRLVRAKGVFDLVEAYAKLDASVRRTLGLVFVGGGPSESELRKRASQIPDGQICFAGFVQKDGLVPYYVLADALVFPTHSDTWGFVVNEAMACRLPVIASSVAGCVADLVEDGWNGRVVPPRRPAAWAEVMTEFAKSGQQLKQMAEHGRQRIREYSPEACANGIAEAVRACV